MRVVITGGAGFLGSRLAEALRERGSLAGTGVRRRRSGRSCCSTRPRAGRLLTVPEGCEAIGGDISDASVAAALARGRSGRVFHLASVVAGWESATSISR